MRKSRDELELKLIVPADYQVPTTFNAGPTITVREDGAPLDLTATYYDTADHRLLSHGITCRHRTGDDSGPLWTIKLPVAGDVALRREVDFVADASTPPADAKALLFGVLAGEPLVPIAEIKTRRWRRALVGEGDEDLAELVDDRVSVLDGSVIRDSYREIEIEAHDATRERIQQVADAITLAGGRPDQRSKLARAMAAVNGTATPDDPPTVTPDGPAEAAIGPALRRALKRFLSYDPYARLGDIEGVHQQRVSARRIRSVLRTFAPLIPEERSAPIVDELRKVGRALGEVRDLDVMLEELRAQAGEGEAALAPVFGTLAARREAASVSLIATLSSADYVAMINALSALASETEWPTSEKSGPIHEVLPELVGRMWRKFERAAGELKHESAEEEFHRVRILAKRARYAAETVGPFTKKKQIECLHTFAERAETVQNVLGEHQDAAVARDTLSALADGLVSNGRAGYWLGRIVEREGQRAEERREAFFDVWKRLEGKKQHKWPNS